MRKSIYIIFRLDTNKDFDTSPELFEQEMKYLYENGYDVITLSDLGYDEKQEQFYIKNSNNEGNELSHSSRIILN
jgi:hypothetical protein